MPDPQVLDLRELIERVGDDKEFAVEMLQDFAAVLADQTAELAKVLEGGERDAVIHAAHTMKGSAANLSLKNLAAVAERMELAGKEDRIEDARGDIEALREEAEKVIQEVAALG